MNKILVNGLRDENSLFVAVEEIGGGVESDENSVVSVSIDAVVMITFGTDC